jgi:hypothetical protein
MVEQNLQFLENAGPGVPEMLIEAGFDDVKKSRRLQKKNFGISKGLAPKQLLRLKP